MKTVNTAEITKLRDANPEDSEDYRVYDACLMRRSKRMSLPKIAAVVGIPRETLRRHLIECNSRRMATRHRDQKYIERGECLALVIGDNALYGEVEKMNDGKNGRPFVYSDEVFKMAAIFKAATGTALRPMEGLIRKQAGGGKRTPSFSQLRKRIKAIKIESGDADGTPFLGICGARYKVTYLIGDGTGMKATSRGEYRQAVYGNCSYKRYSFAVMIDKGSFEAVFVAVEESPGEGEGGKRIGRLTKGGMAKARRSPNISRADTVKILYDGAADKADVYAAAAGEGCELVTPVRIDSSSKASPGRKNALPETPGPETPGPETPGPETPGPETPGPETPGPETPGPETPGPETPGPETPPDPPMIDGEVLRRQAVYKQNGGLDSITPENKAKLDAMSGEEREDHRFDWRTVMKYTMRLLVEAWISGFKRVIGDEIKARTAASMEQELLLKVGIYNHMNDDALAKGYTPTRVVVNEGWAGSKGRRRGKGGRVVKVPAKTKKATTAKTKKGIG